ncbi:MAG: hypothetical protein HFJ12_05655 [Bacilli bacterium]|nr:hypothetical protein [Bacilli bacterium]
MEEINLKELFRFLLSKIKVIILCMLIVMLLGFIYVYFLLTPMYHSSTTLILVSDNNNTNSSMVQSDINLNKNLVSTYSEIVKSRTVLKQVIKELDLDMTVKELSKLIEVELVENTEIIRIEVSNKNNKLAKDMVTTTADTFMKEVQEIYNLTNVSIIDKAYLEKEPYNIDLPKQMIIFAVLGFGFGTLITFLIFYFDTTIKSASDIEEKLDLPVIGNVTLVEKK